MFMVKYVEKSSNSIYNSFNSLVICTQTAGCNANQVCIDPGTIHAKCGMYSCA